MKSRSELWLKVLEDLGDLCSVSTQRSAKTMADRVAAEGESFFTLTLPAYGKEFERTLSRRRIDVRQYPGWARNGSRVKLLARGSDRVIRQKVLPIGTPKFLGEFQRLLFMEVGDISTASPDTYCDLVDGSWYVYPTLTETVQRAKQADAVAAIRQLTLMFSKEEAMPPPKVQSRALQQYKMTDEELDFPLCDAQVSRTLFEDGRLARTKRVVTALFGQALSDLDGMIYRQELEPGHGPGKTADCLIGNQKWSTPLWTERLERLFPHRETLYSSPKFVGEDTPVILLDPWNESPAKVTLVPKTQKNPRIIVMEPTHMQYVQQGISRRLAKLLESDKLHGVDNPGSWFLGFTEQWPNQALARIGSEDGSLATLDLSEASDRVPNWLVEELFADWPWFSEALQVSRSTRVRMPDDPVTGKKGEILPIIKFASMGSALCFPIEAMVFTAIVIERVLSARSFASATELKIPAKILRELRDQVRVYGDDIIVPANTAVTVIDGLELFGFKVNRDKSFWTGEFRESCGKEYWNGFDVSIVKVRQELPTSRHPAENVVSAVATRNLLYKAGTFPRAVAAYDGLLMRVLRGHFPIVQETSVVLGRIDNSIAYDVDDWDVEDGMNRPLVRGYVPVSKLPENPVNSEYATLLKCLIGKSVDSPLDHLERSGRPPAAKLKLVKRTPF